MDCDTLVAERWTKHLGQKDEQMFAKMIVHFRPTFAYRSTKKERWRWVCSNASRQAGMDGDLDGQEDGACGASPD